MYTILMLEGNEPALPLAEYEEPTDVVRRIGSIVSVPESLLPLIVDLHDAADKGDGKSFIHVNINSFHFVVLYTLA